MAWKRDCPQAPTPSHQLTHPPVQKATYSPTSTNLELNLLTNNSETNSELNLLTKSVAYTQKTTNQPTQTIPSFCKGGRSLTKNAMHTEKFKISELNLIFFRAVGVEIAGINSSRNVFVCLRASVF